MLIYYNKAKLLYSFNTLFYLNSCLYCFKASSKRLIPFFITFTINGANYGLDLNTYIRKLKDCLSFADNYVANIDYGSKNGRLHFHAIIDAPISTKAIFDWPYGFVDFKGCYSLMHKYLYKICNHALKKTASTLIYSRKKRK